MRVLHLFFFSLTKNNIGVEPTSRDPPVFSCTRSKFTMTIVRATHESTQANLFEVTATVLELQDAKTDTAITKDLKSSPSCLIAVCTNVGQRYSASILVRARNACHLATRGAIFIARHKLKLRSQKQFVWSFSLFNFNFEFFVLFSLVLSPGIFYLLHITLCVPSDIFNTWLQIPSL